MHFIIILKKENFSSDCVNEDFLSSNTATVVTPKEVKRLDRTKHILFFYLSKIDDSENTHYTDNEKILLFNGMATVNNCLKKITELNENDTLIGDYQFVCIDNNGNGFIKTSIVGLKQLFIYEDENCQVLSTDIRLIVDGICKFREKTFVDHFDTNFIDDSIFRRWNRTFVQSTVFKEIKQVDPEYKKQFINGSFIITEQTPYIPDWFRKYFFEDKNKLFDMYYEFLMRFASTNINVLKNKVKKVGLSLTGGFDSRLHLTILKRVCQENQIEFECNTGGNPAHPDVIIAKWICNLLNIKHINVSQSIAFNTQALEDYMLTFYVSYGGYSSQDPRPFFFRDPEPTFNQYGFSGYKRSTTDDAKVLNVWVSKRRIGNCFFPLFSTDYEMWFGLLYGKEKTKPYKELIYEVLKRAEPILLNIPYVGDYLPQTSIPPFFKTLDSKYHEKEPFLWDYDYAFNSLKSLFNGKTEFEQLFLNLPKTRELIKMSKDSYDDYYLSKLQALMDFSSVANQRSFRDIENYLISKEKIR